MLTDPLLIRYAQELRRRECEEGLDLLVPSNEVYELIREHAGETAYDVVELVSNIIRDKVVREAALLAAREFYGDIDEEEAVDKISRRIAIWYLEVLDRYGFIRLTRRS